MTDRISLTALKWTLVLCTVLLGCLSLAYSYREDVLALWNPPGSSGQGDRTIAQRLIVYRLDDERPSLFTFTQPVKTFRIITHPVIRPDAAKPGAGWNYAIRIELLGLDGDTIGERTVYSRSMLIGQDGKVIGSERFYRAENEVAALLDEVWLFSPNLVSAIRLSSGASDPEIVAVDVRVAERRPQRAPDPISHFQRYSISEQQRLTRANAFPVSMLTDTERAQATWNKWLPVGPAGIGGRDYDMRILYVADSYEPAEDREDGT